MRSHKKLYLMQEAIHKLYSKISLQYSISNVDTDFLIKMGIKLPFEGHFNPRLFNPRLFNHELFNPRLLNPGLFNPKSGVEKSRVEKFMVEKSRVERSGVEAWG